MTKSALKKMTCVQLREKLAMAGLDTQGKKMELVNRLYQAPTTSDPRGGSSDSEEEDGGSASKSRKMGSRRLSRGRSQSKSEVSQARSEATARSQSRGRSRSRARSHSRGGRSQSKPKVIS